MIIAIFACNIVCGINNFLQSLYMAFSFGNVQFSAAPEFEVFDLTIGDLSTLEIVEKSGGGNCFVRSKDMQHYYGAFVLDKNRETTTLCDLQFYKSSTTNHYIPRPTFRKIKNDGTDQTCRGEAIRISFNDSEQAQRFWELMGFLGSFKDLVDTGTFNRKYKVVTADYAQFLRTLDTSEKIKAVTELIRSGNFSLDEIKSLIYESRKRVLKRFLWLLRNKTIKDDLTSRDFYRIKFKLTGEEAIWHHFLKENDWILGLNADLRFTSEYIDEAKVGIEQTDGKGSPKVDFLGVTNYTTLVELKTPDTPIFKVQRGCHSRSNTWEFSTEFISGISQCLGQKLAMDENYTAKTIVDEDGKMISKEVVYNADIKVIFIIGCRYSQFPHNGIVDNKTKSKTFEMFRRNNRNVEIITYDELFERAYHIVMAEKIPQNWFDNDLFEIK